MMTRLVSLMLLTFCTLVVQGQLLSRGEYFIDVDPGYGLGQNFSIPTSTNTSLTFQPDLSSIASGLHRVGFRVKDANGKWSQTGDATFYALPAFSMSNLVKLEYFIDNDPGFGSGIVLSVPNNFQMGVLNFNLNLNGLAQGLHCLHIRGKNALGIWSHVSSTLIYRLDAETITEVKRLEYFFDSDPGFCNGQALSVPSKFTFSGCLNYDIIIDNLT